MDTVVKEARIYQLRLWLLNDGMSDDEAEITACNIMSGFRGYPNEA